MPQILARTRPSSSEEGRFCRILRHFSHSVQLDVSAHFSALDGQQLLLVEGSGGGDAGSLTPRRSVTPISCMRWLLSTETFVIHLVRTTNTTTTTSHVALCVTFIFWCRVTFFDDGQRAALGSCSASEAATTALVVATRAAVDRCGPGCCDAPLHGARRQPSGPERRQGARRTTPHGDRRPCLRGCGRRLRLRWPVRRVRQPRAVTWLPGLLSSRCRRFAAFTAWTTPRSSTSSGQSSRRRRRRRRRGSRSWRTRCST